MSASLVNLGEGRYSLKGELNFHNVAGLWHESQHQFSSKLKDQSVDLSDVVRTDSAGMALLLNWTRWARRNSVTLRFDNSPPQLLQVAESNKLTTLLKFH